jgi:5-methylcytosine-specific restriction endonuclease McrA
VKRNETLRRRHRKIIGADQPPCHICGEAILYDAHYLDPLSFTIDHVTPRSRNGPDALDNIKAAHRKCNRDKSDKVAAGVDFVTERTW